MQVSFKAFWKTRTFTEAGLLNFWFNFDPNLLPEDGQNQEIKNK